MRHRTLAVEGVQFHPESLLTLEGPSLLSNFLASTRAGLRGSDRAGRRAVTALRQCRWRTCPPPPADGGLVVELEGVVVVVVLVVEVVVVVVVVGGGPVDTTMSTELPGFTDVPAGGLEEITSPALLGDDAWLMLPRLRPAWPSTLLAWFCGSPSSEGTRTSAGPDDTVSVTELPLGTLVPGEGLAASTVPAGWLL